MNTTKGRRLISDRTRELAAGFDSTLLSDVAYAVDDGDTLVAEIADAAGRCYYAETEAYDGPGRGTPVHTAASEAYEELSAAIDIRLETLLAAACANVIAEADSWNRSDGEIADAKHEAREWLRVHQTAAERAGVWGEVTA